MKLQEKACIAFGCLFLAAGHSLADGLTTVAFNELTLEANSYWNGSDMSGGFLSEDVLFLNSYTDWGGGYYSWAGFAYSNVEDTNTAGYLNQYAVAGGTGVGGDGIYCVAYDDVWGPETDIVEFPEPSQARGFYVNNTTYAALSMRDGDWVGKKFGGATGQEPDWFKLVIVGKDEDGNVIGSVERYLADFRSDNSADDYIQTGWEWIDLTSLGSGVRTLHFSLTSSDTGDWGMNTPAYFAMDNLVFVRENEWADKTDTAVVGTTVGITKKGDRLYVDVDVANLGGRAARGFVAVVVEYPDGRRILRQRPLHALASMEETTVRVCCMPMHRAPRGTYGITAHVIPLRLRDELTLENNMSVDSFEW